MSDEMHGVIPEQKVWFKKFMAEDGIPRQRERWLQYSLILTLSASILASMIFIDVWVQLGDERQRPEYTYVVVDGESAFQEDQVLKTIRSLPNVTAVRNMTSQLDLTFLNQGVDDPDEQTALKVLKKELPRVIEVELRAQADVANWLEQVQSVVGVQSAYRLNNPHELPGTSPLLLLCMGCVVFFIAILQAWLLSRLFKDRLESQLRYAHMMGLVPSTLSELSRSTIWWWHIKLMLYNGLLGGLLLLMGVSLIATGIISALCVIFCMFSGVRMQGHVVKRLNVAWSSS